MNKEPKVIEQDNLKYLFQPGQNGGLTASAPKKPNLIDMLSQEKPKVAKIVNEPKKMAMGGIADDENNQLTNYLKLQPDAIQKTNDSANLMGLVPHGTVQAPQPQTPANPALAQTNRGSEEEDMGTTENDERIKDSHPGHQTQDLLGAETAQKMEQAGQYGPDQEKMVLDQIMKNQGSIGNRAARGFAGLGDALMGVAGKSGPGFLNSLENRENNQAKMALEANPMLQKMNAEQMGQKQALEEKDPNSPLSRAAQDAYESIFRRMGYPPGSTKNKAASELRTIASLGVEMHGKELEDAVKAAELKINSGRLQQEISNQERQRELEETKLKTGAAGEITKNYNPFKSFFGMGPSKEENAEATKTLAGTASSGSESQDFNQHYKSLPSGSHYIGPDGKMRVKK